MIRDKFTNDRGQVGIGTLIVFIALVLVAAIAAGVLINTAGFLQTQAEETGTESTDQVSNNINVIGEVGIYNETNSGLNETRLTVQRASGSGEIDLSGLSIQYVGDNGFANLVHGTNETASGEAGYLVQTITAESESDAVITDDGDRYELVIPQGPNAINSTDGVYDDSADVVANNDDPKLDFDNSELEVLTEGQEAELEITTDSGATRNVVVKAPDTFVDQDDGDTVTI
jgi:flagellin FlaB